MLLSVLLAPCSLLELFYIIRRALFSLFSLFKLQYLNFIEHTQAGLRETLSTTAELAKLCEPDRFKSDVPIIAPNELSKADGFFFGFPVIRGKIAFKAFIDCV